MLKGILNSLKNGCGVSSDWLKNKGFNYLIKHNYVRLFYSLKFPVSFTEVQNVLKSLIIDETFYKEVLRVCGLYYIKEINTDQLKNSLKEIYTKYKENLEDFDSFFQKVYNALTSYHIYDVVFYNPSAVRDNVDFPDDRNILYLTTRPEYLDALVYANASYIVIYENQKSITTLWAVTSKDFSNIAFFNRIGKEFHRLDELFGNDELKHCVSGNSLAENLGITILYTDDIYVYEKNFDDFRYNLHCPNCDRYISSEHLRLTRDGVKCYYCKDPVTKKRKRSKVA